MILWNRLKNLDDKFPGAFAGVVIGAVGTGFGIWAYFNSPSPELTYEILTNTPVLDIREEVDNLEILYDGQNITDSDRSLQVVTFRVVNSGRIEITQGLYDAENAPLGLRLSDGQIVQSPRVISSSNQYIADNLNPSVASPTDIQFSPVVLNPQDYFTLKILALVPSEEVIVEPIGIVAGIDKIRLVESYREGDPAYERLVFFTRVLLWASIGLLLWYCYTFVTRLINNRVEKRLKSQQPMLNLSSLLMKDVSEQQLVEVAKAIHSLSKLSYGNSSESNKEENDDTA